MYASRSRCDSPSLSTLATSLVPSSRSTLKTSPIQPPPSGRALFKRSPKESSTPSAMILSTKAVDVAQAVRRDNLPEASVVVGDDVRLMHGTQLEGANPFVFADG